MGIFDFFKNNKDQADKLDRENATALSNMSTLNTKIMAAMQAEKMQQDFQAAMSENIEKLKAEGRGI